MKKLVHAVVVVMCLFLPGNLMAEECMEGDCDNGFGTGFTADSKIYEGEWKKGLPDGHGKLYLSKGKVIEGRWEKGVLVEEKKVEKKDKDK